MEFPSPAAGQVSADREQAALNRARTGDLAAFEPLVKTHWPRANRYACALVRDPHEALDLCQEAFVRAWKAMPGFEPGRPFFPWFARILRNVCFTHLEKQKRNPVRPGERDGLELLLQETSPEDDPAGRFARREQAALTGKALASLSVDHREILVLRHFEDLAYDEIADVLALPLGTVMSRLFHARKNLVRAMRDLDSVE